MSRLLLSLSLVSVVSSVGCSSPNEFAAGSGSIVSEYPKESPTPDPKGPKVVTKGSFSAWSIPADPQPGQKYELHLQVSVDDPDNTYNCSDLSGSIKGTDLFFISIENYCRGDGNFLVNSQRGGGQTKSMFHYRFNIPGASAKIEDTLKVRSKRLGENQTLIIEF